MNIEQLQSFFKKVYEEPDGEYLQCLLYPVFEALVNEDLVNEDGWVYRDDIISFINKKYNFNDDDWKRKALSFDHLYSQRFGRGDQKDFLNNLVVHDGKNPGDKKTKFKFKSSEEFMLIREFIDSGFCKIEAIEKQLHQRITNLVKKAELKRIKDTSDIKVDEENHPTIWKISHGRITDFSDEEHNRLLENNYVATNFQPENPLHQKLEAIKPNHYFYLVRDAKIILLGQLENEQSKEIEGMPGQQCRKFKPVIMLDIPYPVTKLEKKYMNLGGMPSSNSTVAEVKSEHLKYFESDVLQPVFKLSLEDLIITPSSDENHDDIEQPTGDKMHSRNQILFGPPGTGKTYNTVNKAIEIASPSFKLDQDREKIKAEFDRLMKEGQIVFTTFHQSMCYEDFIEGIKPETTPDDKRVIYEVKPGIFKNLCQAATTPNLIGFNAAYEQLIKDLSEIEAADSDTTEVKTIEIKTPTGKPFSISLNSNNNLSLHTGPNKIKQGTLTRENIQAQINGDVKFIGWNGYFEGVCNYLKENYNYSSTSENTAKNFVLIIDEINRGNVSQIFGELITLIEDDKRLGKDEAIMVTLPYSKKEFGVPSNLYIIGTMNTADRSVEALDAALRRRFSFEEMPPKSDLIKKEGKLSKTEGILELDEFDDIDLPLLLNKINERLEKLLDKDHQIGHSYFIKVENLEGLRLAFQNKIIPLLQEYFFGDYGKIGLVLGEGFVEKEPLKESIFAYFPDADADDFSDRPIFKIKKLTSDDDFIKAINLLLNKKTDG